MMMLCRYEIVLQAARDADRGRSTNDSSGTLYRMRGSHQRFETLNSTGLLLQRQELLPDGGRLLFDLHPKEMEQSVTAQFRNHVRAHLVHIDVRCESRNAASTVCGDYRAACLCTPFRRN